MSKSGNVETSPRGSQSTEWTQAAWPASVWSGEGLPSAQTMSWQSREQEQTKRLSGLQQRDVTSRVEGEEGRHQSDGL